MIIDETAATMTRRRRNEHEVQLQLVESGAAPLQSYRQSPPQKATDDMTYDELMEDLQRLHDEDDSDEEYDDLIAGQNGAPSMVEIQANDKVSEVMELMSGFIDGQGENKAVVPQSNYYDDLDSMLQVSETETESGVTSLADISGSGSKSGGSGTKSSRRRRKAPQARKRTSALNASSTNSEKRTKSAKAEDNVTFVGSNTMVFRRSSPSPKKRR